MGYRRWTAMEEEALLAGVAKHGVGKWVNILRDPEFSSAISERSNTSIQDKRRNMSIGNRMQSPIDQSAGAGTSSETLVGSPTADLIFDALKSIKDVNGSNIGEIASFIKQNHGVWKHWRVLDSKLRKLAQQGKLEKDGERFKLCNEETLEDAAENAAPKVAQEDQESFSTEEADSEENMNDAAETMIDLSTKGKSKC